MKFEVDWKGWNLGGKVIFSAACVAVISTLMPWADFGFGSRNAFFVFAQGFNVFLGIVLLLAIAYPLKYMLSKEVFNKNLAFGLAGASSVICLYFV